MSLTDDDLEMLRNSGSGWGAVDADELKGGLIGGVDDHTADSLKYAQDQRRSAEQGADHERKRLKFTLNNAADPTPNTPVQIKPKFGEMTDEEAQLAIGTYMTNFVEYGLMPSVEQATNHGKWRVVLASASGDAFRMEVTADSLVDALSQADMAAGGWHAQKEIERNLFETSLNESLGAGRASIVETMAGLVAAMDRAEVPDKQRHMIVSPSTYKELVEQSGAGRWPNDAEDGQKGQLFGVPLSVSSAATSTQQLRVLPDYGILVPESYVRL